MTDLYYEDDSEQWRKCIERAVDANEFLIARAMAGIGPKVTTGKSKWTKPYVAAMLCVICTKEKKLRFSKKRKSWQRKSNLVNDRCDWTKCKNPADVGYQKNKLDSLKEMCQEHWIKFCDMQEDDKENEARKKIGLPVIKRLIDG